MAAGSGRSPIVKSAQFEIRSGAGEVSMVTSGWFNLNLIT